MSGVELLAPAGSFDSLKAAVNAGADAVYAGAKNFNARVGADNFDEQALSEAIDYCHTGSVKFFLVLNTLIHDEEMTGALKLLEKACNYGIDAVIVQDLGLMYNIARFFPRLDLHASTQSTVYNLNGVLEMQRLGAKRVILARECSIDKIRYVSQSSPIETEIFVHGAMCVSYSGQCLMSSFIGERSGNRGKCAQPCRLQYTMTHNGKKSNTMNEKKSYLSLKDLCMIERLPELLSTSIKSLKIEGRMRSPEYVACTVSIYRKYIDLAYSDPDNFRVDPKDMNDLLMIFNRGELWSGYAFDKNFKSMAASNTAGKEGIYAGTGYKADRPGLIKVLLETDITNGDGVYLYGENRKRSGLYISYILDEKGRKVDGAQSGDTVIIGYCKDILGDKFQVYKTYDKTLINRMKKIIGKGPYKNKKDTLNAYFQMEINKPPILIVTDESGDEVRIEGDTIATKAINKPISEEDVVTRLRKTGSTSYRFNTIECKMGNDLFIPLTNINEMRRKAVEKLDRLNEKTPILLSRISDFPPAAAIPGKSSFTGVPLLNGYFYLYDSDMDYSELDLDEITLPMSELDESTIEILANMLKKKNKKLYLSIPGVPDENAYRTASNLLKSGSLRAVDGIYAGTTGVVNMLLQASRYSVLGDIGLNVFNGYTFNYLIERGLKRVTASVELNKHEFIKIADLAPAKTEVTVYGQIPVMTTAFCPVGGAGFCKDIKPGGCKVGKNNFSLIDRKGKVFDLINDKADCGGIVLNSDRLFITHDIKIGCNRLCFYKESYDDIKRIIDAYKNKRMLDFFDSVTTGHWKRGV